jgi:hypothetical protein
MMAMGKIFRDLADQTTTNPRYINITVSAHTPLIRISGVATRRSMRLSRTHLDFKALDIVSGRQYPPYTRKETPLTHFSGVAQYDLRSYCAQGFLAGTVVLGGGNWLIFIDQVIPHRLTKQEETEAHQESSLRKYRGEVGIGVINYAHASLA